MLCGMEQDPLQKDKKKKRGRGGVAATLRSSQITLWPLDDTSHQQAAAELFTDDSQLVIYFRR